MFTRSRYHFFLWLLLLVSVTGKAQQKSNKGKEFWLGYGHNVLFTQGANSQQHVLYLSAEAPATVTVSVNGTSWSRTVSIPANSVDVSVIIPQSGPDDARILSEGLNRRGVHIVSDTPIVAYAHQQGNVSSGATLLMPVETFGYTYYSLNFTQVSNYPESYSWFYVIAAEDNTRLEITPSDSTEGGWLPGQTYTVNLNKGELWNIFGKSTGTFTGKDMTGSKVVSVTGADGNCHPVAVFSGSSRNIICSPGNGGEVMQQQIFPANAWGTRYLTYHTVLNTSGTMQTPFLNYYRVAVRNPGTVVKRNGTILTGLLNNFYYEFTSEDGDLIEADQPVLVAQYHVSENQCGLNSYEPPLGDPEMMYLSPVEQGVRQAVFYATRNQAIDYNFIQLIVPAAGLSSLRINGAAPLPAEYSPHPKTAAYTVVVKRLFGAAAQYRVTCDSSFIANVYGAGYYESYGYNMGTLVNNLNGLGTFHNQLSLQSGPDSSTCPNSPFRLSVSLAWKVTMLHWKLSQVPGLSPAADSIQLSPVPSDSFYIYGRKYYRYSLQQDFTLNAAGNYFIPVSYRAPEIDACNQEEKLTIAVPVKPGPVAGFQFSDPLCTGKEIQFTGNASGPFTFSSHTWSFDGGGLMTGTAVLKTFFTTGSHQVQYSITTANGCVADSTRTILIHPRPVADFILSPPPYCSESPVTFSSGVTDILRWNWNLGNGFSASAPPFTHYYAAGNYQLSLQGISAEGCESDPVQRSLQVFPKPVVEAGPDTLVKAGTSFSLHASVQPAGSYRYTWSPSRYLDAPATVNPLCTPLEETLYRLMVTDAASGCSASDERLVTVQSGLFIPSAFSPNGDGKNDTWQIPGLVFYPGARVMVFNRSGQLLFAGTNYLQKPWDGRFGGVLQPAGIYVYLIELNDGHSLPVKGTLSLIR